MNRHDLAPSLFAGNYRVNCIFLLIATLLTAGCSQHRSSGDLARLRPPANRVVTVSYALQYLTQRIVGDKIQVDFPASEVEDPKSWSPSAADISSLQRADLIIVNGSSAPFANWLVHVTLPANKICESCDEIPLSSLIAVPDYEIVHSHGPEGEHSHAYIVPHTWLDPKLAGIQAKTIAAKLETVYPDLRETIRNNLDELLRELQELSQISGGSTPLPVITSNPHMKYLTKAAGLNDFHLLWFQSDDSTTEGSFAKLQKLARQNQPRAMLINANPDDNLSAFCKEQQIDLIDIDLLEVSPKSSDFMTAMEQNLKRLAALQK